MSPNSFKPATTGGSTEPSNQKYAAASVSRVKAITERTDTLCCGISDTKKAIEELMEELHSILDMLEDIAENIDFYNTAVDEFNECFQRLHSLLAKQATLENELKELLAEAKKWLQDKLQELSLKLDPTASPSDP